MAENIRHIPERFGTVQEVWHPRITSMGRRLMACLPAVVLGLGCLAVLWMRRPAPVVTAIIVLIILICMALCWMWLRPTTVAVTDTHVLGSRTIGFHTAQRARVARAILVSDLKSPSRQAGENHGKSRGKGLARPFLWLTDDAGRRLFSLDGTVWDLRSLDHLADYLSVPVERVQRVTPGELAKDWPRILTVRMRHPWIGSVFSGALLIATVAGVFWLAWNGS